MKHIALLLDHRSPASHQGSNKSPHRLADEAQRLCDKIGIPFHTFVLRALKINHVIAWEKADYMKDKGISSIRYFTVAFNDGVQKSS